VIKEDATSYDIAKTLKSKGLIEDTLVSGYRKTFKLQWENETRHISTQYCLYTKQDHGNSCR